MEKIHVYPLNDLIEHETVSDECMCNPQLIYDLDNDSCIIVHTSMDRRECFEPKV